MGRIASLEVCVRDADPHYFPHQNLCLVQKGVLCSLRGRVGLWGLVVRLPDETHRGIRRADSWGFVKILDKSGVLWRQVSSLTVLFFFFCPMVFYPVILEIKCRYISS